MFCQLLAEKANFHSNLTKNLHLKKSFFLNPTPNDPLFTTKSCTEWPLFSFSGRHILFTFIFECPPPPMPIRHSKVERVKVLVSVHRHELRRGIFLFYSNRIILILLQKAPTLQPGLQLNQNYTINIFFSVCDRFILNHNTRCFRLCGQSNFFVFSQFKITVQ